jgi:hypothetical protein
MVAYIQRYTRALKKSRPFIDGLNQQQLQLWPVAFPEATSSPSLTPLICTA